eukprot:CAMPEP_0184123000 /NCGR_PEP_ID=MMETSP0974-20121125/23778_1 /TAXON_ID=483370 /ORGANISM="non described non described, Strain CCMP2097" /LENGTH=84 /DNA_ID=CAMNT_0026426257 /DNA_START=14 /DNA_END=264 /DNA_ORIENTATION=+
MAPAMQYFKPRPLLGPRAPLELDDEAHDAKPLTALAAKQGPAPDALSRLKPREHFQGGAKKRRQPLERGATGLPWPRRADFVRR